MNTDFDIDLYINHDGPLHRTEDLEHKINDYLTGIDDLIKDHLLEYENWSSDRISDELTIGFRCDLIETT